YVRNEYYDVSGLYGYLRLGEYLPENYILRSGLHSSCVYKRKFVVKPVHVGVYPVSCNAGRILNYGNPLAGKPVKKRRFSDIGPAHDCNYGSAHLYILRIQSSNILSTRLLAE